MRKTIFILALALVALVATAQDSVQVSKAQPEQHFHYLLLEGGGGLGSLLQDGKEGKGVLSHGATFSLSYEYMFHRRWGIGVGVGASYLTAQTRYQDYFYKEQGLIHPDNGRLFDSHVQFTNWREDQKMWTVNIPVQLINYEPLTQQWALLTRIGLTVNIPVQSRYVLKSGEFSTKGYFPSTNVLYDNDTYVAMDQHGFGKRKAEGQEGELDILPANLSAQIEFGALYRLHRNVSLYFGLYADYGLLNYAKSHTSQLYNSDSRQYVGAFQTTDVRSVHPVEAGLKVGFRFGMGKDREPEQNWAPCPECPQCPEITPCPEPTPCPEITPCPEPTPCPEVVPCPEPIIVHDTIIQTRIDTVIVTNEVVQQQNEVLQQILMSAHFQTNMYDPIFSADAPKLFRKLRALMTLQEESTIIVTGHTDSTGPEESNKKLSMWRAEAFKKALVERGIDETRIRCVGVGSAKPIAPNNTPEGRAANRRVEIEVQ